MKKANRLKLNAMSRAVYGVPSRWQTIMRKGKLIQLDDGSYKLVKPTLRDVYKVMRLIIAEKINTIKESKNEYSKKD